MNKSNDKKQLLHGQINLAKRNGICRGGLQNYFLNNS